MSSNDDFIPEIERMDLEKLKDKTFLVAMSSGNRDESDYLPSSIRGPFSFYDMCEYAGKMWRERQAHSKIITTSTVLETPNDFLDAKTTDYIESRFEDIILDAIIMDSLELKPTDFTCEAELIPVPVEDAPKA